MYWYDASSACKSYGGNLASIHNKKDDDYIAGKLFFNKIYGNFQQGKNFLPMVKWQTSHFIRNWSKIRFR